MAEAAAKLTGEFNAIELTFDHGVSLPPRLGLIEDLAALQARHMLRYVVHLPLTIQLASANPELRRASVETLTDVFALCAPLNPEAWVLHVTPLFGVERSIAGRARAIQQQARALTNASEALDELLTRTDVPSRRIAVENLNYPFEILDSLLETHDLGVCFDVGHLLLQRGNPAAFVRRYANRLTHVHLHDVIDGLDHRPLGDPTGRLDPMSLLRALDESGYQKLVTLEVFNEEHIARSLALVRTFRENDISDLTVGTTDCVDAGAIEIPRVSADDPPVRFTGQVAPTPRRHYLLHEFELAPGLTQLTVTLRYRKEHLCQIFLAVFDPEEYRGTRMNPAGFGDIALELRMSEHDASPGARPGPLRPGRWRLLVDIERTTETADYTLDVVSEVLPTNAVSEDRPAVMPHAIHTPDPTTLRGGESATIDTPSHEDGTEAWSVREVGWYRGELHVHSWHSDGKVPVSQVIEAARGYGLDFLALTDHFTNAGWPEAVALADRDLAVLRGIELTGHSGHANLHGLDRWINVYTDGPATDAHGNTVTVEPGIDSWDVNAIARATRDCGGLFCVNHAFAGDLGWRYHEFDWDLADLIEVYHHLEGPHNALQLGLWDEQLRQGRRIIGVAGTDSHHPREARHRLGQCFTYVYAQELSASGVINGLRTGRVYISTGPRLDFWAESNGARADMGGAANVAEQLKLHVTLRNLQYPAQLFLLKNGFFHEAVRVEPSGRDNECEIVFTDTSPLTRSYYRLELYAAQPQESRIYRQPSALLALSNPIFVT